MLKKEGLVLALYVITSVAITAHAGVEIWKTVRAEKRMNRLAMKAKKID